MDFSDLSPKIQNHLSKVYGVLALTLACSSATVFVTPQWVGQSLGLQILALIASIALIFTIIGSQNDSTRMYSLMGFGILKGMFIAPIVKHYANIDPAIVVNALLLTTCIFSAMTVIALRAKRRSLLFLGGICSSIMLYVCIASLLSWITGFYLLSNMAYNLLMTGVFSMYVIFDTQLIIEKCDMGDTNVYAHALDLFIDFVRLFIHILRILGESKKKRDD